MTGTTTVPEQPPNPTVQGFGAFWANPDPAVLPPALATDVVGYFPGDEEPVRGVAAYVARIGRFLDAFPDLRLEVNEYATNGEFTFIRWTARATGARGRFEFSGMDRIRVKDGLVAENIVVFDTVELVRLAGS